MSGYKETGVMGDWDRRASRTGECLDLDFAHRPPGNEHVIDPADQLFGGRILGHVLVGDETPTLVFPMQVVDQQDTDVGAGVVGSEMLDHRLAVEQVGAALPDATVADEEAVEDKSRTSPLA